MDNTHIDNTSTSLCRNHNIDLIKIFAMIGVVELHCPPVFAGREFDFVGQFYRFFVVSIPLFFMVSGYLLLGRKNINLRYSLKKIRRIIRFVAIVASAYWLFDVVSNKATLSLNSYLRYLIDPYIGQGEFSTFWFFTALIFLYALYPITNRLFPKGHITRGGIWLIAAMIIIQQTVFFGVLIWPAEGHVMEYPFILWSPWNWILYFCLGAAVKTRRLDFLGHPLAVVILFALNVYMQLRLLPCISNWRLDYFYTAIPTIALTAGVFIFIEKLQIRNTKFISAVSSTFLMVYLIHRIVIACVFEIFPILGPATPILFWITATICCIASAWLLIKIPGVNRIVKI